MASNDTGLASVTLRQLLIFTATVDTGSAGGAARNLGLSQPAVTHALAKLEALFAHQLLHRGQLGMVPTQAGHILHRRALRLRQQLVAALAQARGQMATSGDQRHAEAITSTQVACHTAVAEHGAFNLAARALGISLPALQRTARSFEQLVGVPLYHRLRHVGVTAAGEQLARGLRVAIIELAQARDEIDELMGLGGGRMALGCLPLMPKPLLAQMFSAALAQNPGLTLTLEENSYDQLVRDLRHGRLDLIFGALRLAGAEDIDETALFDDPYVVVARSGHALAHRKRPSLAALARCSWVVAPLDTPRRRALEQLFSKTSSLPHMVLETNSVNMTLASLLGNDFLTITARSLATGAGSDPALAILDIPVSDAIRTIGFTMRRGWLPTTAQANFISCIQQAGSGGGGSRRPPSERSLLHAPKKRE